MALPLAILYAASFCACTDKADARYYLKGVLLATNGDVAATTGSVMACFNDKSPEAHLTEDVIVPLDVIQKAWKATPSKNGGKWSLVTIRKLSELDYELQVGTQPEYFEFQAIHDKRDNKPAKFVDYKRVLKSRPHEDDLAHAHFKFEELMVFQKMADVLERGQAYVFPAKDTGTVGRFGSAYVQLGNDGAHDDFKGVITVIRSSGG